MAAVKEKPVCTDTEDIREIMELLKNLTYIEKEQVKGIMIGMQMTRQMAAAAHTA